MQPEPAQAPASLRIAEVFIGGFRAFGPRTPVPFVGGAGAPPEPVVVLQGEGGAGRSTAFAALDFFFRAAVAFLASGSSTGFEGELAVPWDLLFSVGHRDVLVRARDRHPGEAGPIEIEVRFGHGGPGSLRLRVLPSGDTARLRLDRGEGSASRLSPRECAELLPLLESPYGPGSRAVAVLTARRRALWLPDEPQPSPMPPQLAAQLYRLRTSLSPQDRQRWRLFGELLSRFEAFSGREVSVDRLDAGAPQLMVEERGRVVLPLSELASGEQQIAVICASLLLCRAPILCVEKPEAMLDAKSQRLLSEVLDGCARAGFIDQLLLESNSPAFASGHALRFTRGKGGEAKVERAPEPARRPQAT